VFQTTSQPVFQSVAQEESQVDLSVILSDPSPVAHFVTVFILESTYAESGAPSEKA
jgi:hypothetical protein